MPAIPFNGLTAAIFEILSFPTKNPTNRFSPITETSQCVAELKAAVVQRPIVPDKYASFPGICLVDSTGNFITRTIRTLRKARLEFVFDRQYTPTLLDQQNHRYVPAEAVYAVFESKPHFDKSYLEYAGEKAASVRKLHRTSVEIHHAGGIFPAKKLFPIIAGIVAPKSSWVDGLGESFRKNLSHTGDEHLDCGCALEHGAFDDFDGTLQITASADSMMFFLFRLLGKLQSLATVPAIDWGAYATICKV